MYLQIHLQVPAMSKKSKRTQVLLPPDVHEIVEKISAIGGVSISSLLSEIITDSKGGLLMILEALEKAKQQDRTGAIERIQSGLLDSVAQGAQMANDLNKEKDKL
jgi:hypothetical protein